MMNIRVMGVLPVIAVLAAFTAQAKIINYTFTGVVMGNADTPFLDDIFINDGDTFVVSFSVDTDGVGVYKGTSSGNYYDTVRTISSSLTITNAETSAVTVDLTSSSGNFQTAGTENKPSISREWFRFSSTGFFEPIDNSSTYELASFGVSLEGPIGTLSEASEGGWLLFPEVLNLADWYGYHETALSLGLHGGSVNGGNAYVPGIITGASAVVVPEPASYAALFASVILGLVVIRRRNG